ncbi:MAG: Anaerobic dimethyl sulfoxide reductase subunit C, partial [Actinomyces urogenitalis DORA_12]
MNTAELPMILFTVLAQMSVGAFLTLGLVQADGLIRKQPTAATDRVTRAALFAVGPLLVLGFFAAFFHLGDPFHAVNTLRHVDSSWLSREILFGVLYGGLGFVYTATEWLGKG